MTSLFIVPNKEEPFITQPQRSQFSLDLGPRDAKGRFHNQYGISEYYKYDRMAWRKKLYPELAPRRSHKQYDPVFDQYTEMKFKPQYSDALLEELKRRQQAEEKEIERRQLFIQKESRKDRTLRFAHQKQKPQMNFARDWGVDYIDTTKPHRFYASFFN